MTIERLLGFVGQLLLVALGSMLTVIGSWSIQYYRDQRRKYTIRKSLKVEIEGAEHRLRGIVNGRTSNALSSSGKDNVLSTKMYDQHLTELGILTEDELEYAASYYRRIDQILYYQEQYDDLLASEDEFDDESVFESYKDKWRSWASEVAEDALIDKDKLVEEIEENLDESWLFGSVATDTR